MVRFEVEEQMAVERVPGRAVLADAADGAAEADAGVLAAVHHRQLLQLANQTAVVDLVQIGQFLHRARDGLPGVSQAHRSGRQQSGQRRREHIRADHVQLVPGHRPVWRERHFDLAVAQDHQAADLRTQ